MSLTLEQLSRLPKALQDYYATRKIDEIEIDGNIITGYFSYTYFDAKTYFKSPVRSAGGVIDNLNSYATFLTPRLKINFKAMDIETYRVIMKLIQQKNEFTITCYDPVWDKRVTHKMYFQPEDYPELYTYNLEVLRVINYTIELTGTNSELTNVSIIYHTNPPSGYGTDQTVGESDIAKGTTFIMGSGATINSVKIQDMTFNNTHRFSKWCETEDGTGFKYVNGEEYTMNKDLVVYAIWENAQ